MPWDLEKLVKFSPLHLIVKMRVWDIFLQRGWGIHHNTIPWGPFGITLWIHM